MDWVRWQTGDMMPSWDWYVPYPPYPESLKYLDPEQTFEEFMEDMQFLADVWLGKELSKKGPR